LDLAWEKCGQLFLLVEPGTPRGFEALRKARLRLISQGAKVAAPCPHEEACPMPQNAAERWCHFSARLERRKAARFIKGGEQGWEDERFTYLALTREPWPRPKGRVIGAPRLVEGEAHADLCLPEGLTHLTAPKHRKARFKVLRKAHWGGPWQGSARPGGDGES
jgi:ribosomal protein RSM22 (predicted rRNA methylase)